MIRPLRARYVGYTTGTENHGDEALMWIIAGLLAPEIDVVHGGDHYDIAFLGGGTLINQSPWLLDHYRNVLAKAPLGGFVFGSGVGDPAFWGDHFAAWRKVLEPMNFIGVRGPRSIHHLATAGLAQCEMIGDPYLAIHPPLAIPPTPGRIGVNFGTTNNSLWGGDEEGYMEFLLEALSRLVERGWEPAFYSVWSKDLPLILAMRDRLGLPDAPVLDARSDSLEALSRLTSCEVFVGEKLHACAMAAVAGVPFMALEYQPKVRDFAESLDMGDYTVSTGERDPEGFVHLVESLAANQAPVRARMAGNVAAFREGLAGYSRRIQHHFSGIRDERSRQP